MLVQLDPDYGFVKYTLIKTYLWVPSEYTYNAAMLFYSFGSFIQALSDYLLSSGNTFSISVLKKNI